MKDMSLFDVLTKFLGRQENLHVLFRLKPDERSIAVEPAVLAQFLAASQWNDLIRSIADRLHDIAFEELRDPKPSTQGDLHDMRDYLNTHRTTLDEERRHLLEGGAWERYYGTNDLSKFRWSGTTFAQISRDAIEHERFLMDTF